MKKTLDSLIVLGVLCALLQMSSASFAQCLNDDEGRAEIGHAFGVLIYENIVKDYASQVSIMGIAAGLKDASSDEEFELSLKDEDASTGTSTDRKMSVSAAQNIINNWRAAPESIGERFVSAYEKRSETTPEKSGLLWRQIVQKGSTDTSDTSDAIKPTVASELKRCMDSNINTKSDKSGDGKHVCFAQLEISEKAICDATKEENEYLQNSTTAISYGQFEANEVIAGWAEAFEILDNETSDDSRDQDEYDYLELVVPPELAYGTKGLPGKVDSNEILWFVMAVR